MTICIADFFTSGGQLFLTLNLDTLQNPNSEKEKELEKQARIEASLRERERAVQRFRSEQTKEIDREREQHKREEAVQHFKALMSDMVKTHRPYGLFIN